MTRIVAILALCSALLFSACVPVAPQPVAYAPPANLGEQQREAYAKNAGYPTKKSKEEFEAQVARFTKEHRLVKKSEGQLGTGPVITIDAAADTCYTIVIRLREGAAWGKGAEPGVRFDFTSARWPNGGSAGPGLIGPGAIAGVGCMNGKGPLTISMNHFAQIFANEPIGSGAYDLELWSKKLTAEEKQHLIEDEQRQIAEAEAFKREEDAKKQRRLASGCAKCDARYQGCVGAGRSEYSCQQEYRSCAFVNAGPDYVSVCPNGTR
jgi:hypothetical protein